jgi:glycosyltransferase involved in cell wall biosynthesis
MVLRILFVNYEYPPLGGGGGIVNAWLAEELAMRHDVTVLTSKAFNLPDSDVVNNVEIIRCPTLFRKDKATASFPSMATFVISGLLEGRKLVRHRDFDIINTHFAVPTGPVGAWLSGIADTPNVLSVHGGDLYDPSKWTSPHRHGSLRYVVRRVTRAADAVVGQSKNTNENLCRFFDSSAKPELIPLGIPRPPPSTASRGELGFDTDDTILVTVGRLVGRKQVSQLVSLVRQLADKKLRLVVIGDGPQLSALEQQAAQFDIADQVTFAGFVSDQKKVDLLAASDIYVSTSQHEGFGLVFLEAMAQGLPVVCYNHGGQTDFLVDRINGAILPVNDTAAFASSVDELVKDPERRKAISARNRADVEQLFIDSCARQYEAIFRKVLNSRA